ncbi:MAG: ABC transporter substrate-binding protein [Clostridiales bacterium]|nr:ABC transporter substrate-binding protein [Clostridiales bacterium]
MFKKEFDIKVNYSTFTTSEEAYAKIKSGAVKYDLVIVSDYIIEQLSRENLLEKIDFKKIANFENIYNRLKSKEKKFSVSYFFGTLGILYNKKFVAKPPSSWSILWDKSFCDEIFMLDSQRDSITVALKKLNFDLNTRNTEELKLAKKELIKQKEIVQAYLCDVVRDKMILEEGKLAVVYSGDAFICQQENKNLDFVIPKEGSNIWSDEIAILKNSDNLEYAYEFINFLCREDISFMNTKYTGYTTSNYKTFLDMPKEIKNNRIYWPSDDVLNRCVNFKYLENFSKIYDKIWLEVLAH